MSLIPVPAAMQAATRGFYPKVINGSLRFNDDDSAYLSWTPASAGNRKTWTWSAWVKRGNLGSRQFIFTTGDTGTNGFYFEFDANDSLNFGDYSSGFIWQKTTSAVYRDVSAWYHIVLRYDTTEVTPSDRIKLYVNGSQVTAFGTNTNPTSNYDGYINGTTYPHALGRFGQLNSLYTDGYLAEVHFIDGQALTADDFGELKNGVWVAKDYAGTFGTNGFYLTFEDDTQVEAFNTVLYRGNGGTQSITGVGFLPDLVWLKRRGSAVASNRLLDTVRGVQKNLYSDLNSAEQTQNSVMSFDSDGFTVGDSAGTNGSGDTFVAWCWKAGGAPTVDNSAGAGNVPTAGSVKIDGVNSTSALAGSIPATRLSASTTYGLSIVSYTGDSTGTDGTPSTVAHGLSQAPEMIMFKPLDTYDGAVYHSGLTSASYRLVLFSASGTLTQASDNGFFNGTAPTSSVFSIGSRKHTNSNGGMIAYCFHSVEGYSKFGSYEGNGSTNGPEIDCGFVPALVLIKDIGRAEHWVIFDGTRETQNDRNLRLFPSSNSVESPIPTGDGVRFLSTANGDSINGFKITTNSYGINDNVDSDVTKIYAAFADTREAAFWLDQSGNDNDWQPVNLDHNDTVADSPTNNFATLNPLKVGTTYKPTFSDGNLRYEAENATQNPACATLALSSGSFYFEGTLENVGYVAGIGVCDPSSNFGTGDNWRTYQQGVILFNNGTLYVDGTSSSSGYTFSEGDVIGIACDVDSGKVFIHKNGTYFNSGDPVAGTGAVGTTTNYTELTGMVDGTEVTGKDTWVLNFGQQPFKYNPPS